MRPSFAWLSWHELKDGFGMKFKIALFLFWALAVSSMVYLAMQKAEWLAEEPARAKQSPFQELFNPLELGEDASPDAKKAMAAAEALTVALGTQLKSALQNGTPREAIEICGAVAQKMTIALARDQGVILKRSALKLRNSKNVADSFERAWMDSQSIFSAAYAAPPHGEVVTNAEGVEEYRRITPIYIRPLCLSCHGDPAKMDSDVLEYLNENYPHDQATGFVDGEFRGIISVRVPL
jgi:hypothetical protein